MSRIQTGYSGLQITLHWLIALLVLFQLMFGESMTGYVDAMSEGSTPAPGDALMGQAHYWVGLTVLGLVILRLGVRLAYGTPKAEDAGPRWMALAAGAAHVLFYLLLIAVPVSGLLAYYTWDWMGDVHAAAKPVFIVLIAGHASAALFHHFVLRDGVLKRMLTSGAAAD